MHGIVTLSSGNTFVVADGTEISNDGFQDVILKVYKIVV